MPDLNSITLDKASLQTLDIANAMAQYGEKIILEHDNAAMRDFVSLFQHAYAELFARNPETPIEEKYDRLIKLMRYILIASTARDEDVRGIFSHDLAGILSSDENLRAPLRGKLLTFPLGERDAFKRLLIDAMQENGERITARQLQSAAGIKEPTIANWLKDYLSYFADAYQITRTKAAEYLASSPNAKVLTTEERRRLSRLIDLYGYLHMSSETPEGIEEEFAFLDPNDGEWKDFNRGNPVSLIAHAHAPIKSHPILYASRTPAAPITSSFPSPRPSSAPSVPPSPAFDAAKIQEVRGVLAQRGKEPIALFFDLLVPPQGVSTVKPEELIGGLIILAEDNLLEKAIVEPKLKEQFMWHLRTKNQPDLLEGFRLTPTMPKFMSLFLQWALQEKGKLTENDAAQIGARIANMLKKRGNEKYSRIAYFDAASGTFKWS